MAEAVVHHLEPIEVEVQHREPVFDPPSLEFLELLPELLDEHATVAQSGQGIAVPGTAKLLLFPRSLRRIGERSGDARRTPIRASQGNTPAHEPPVGAVLVADAVLELQVTGFAGRMRLERLFERHDVVIVDTLDPVLWTRSGGRRLQANHGPPPARDVEVVTAQIPFPETVIRSLGRERESLFLSLGTYAPHAVDR